LTVPKKPGVSITRTNCPEEVVPSKADVFDVRENSVDKEEVSNTSSPKIALPVVLLPTSDFPNIKILNRTSKEK
jgi:hypothetical protein